MTRPVPPSSVPASAAAVLPLERTRFPPARPDRQVVIVTILFAGTFLWFALQTAVSLYLSEPPSAFEEGGTLLVGAVMFWRWLNSVRGYAIQTGGGADPVLLIRRLAPWATVRIALSRLREATANPALRGIMNTNMLSQGSLFGWSGPAFVPEIGPVLAFATSRRQAVLLELSPRDEDRGRTSDGAPIRGPIVLISPRDPAALLAALQPFLPGPATVGPLPVSKSRPPRPAAPSRKRR